MKRTSLLVIIVACIVSCNTKTSEEAAVVTDSSAVMVKPDSAVVITDDHYFWVSDLDPKSGLVMKKDSPVNKDSLTPSFMINRLNSLYPEIKLELVKVSNDSIFVKINKGKYLTQQMGSSGAEAYLAEVTYNLSEIKNIGFVDIRFKEGDHASPGTYSRTDFVHPKN